MTAPNRPAAPPPERIAPPARPPKISVAAVELPGWKTYVAMLWRHRRLLAALPIVLGGIAGGLSLLRPRQYAARAAFVATEPQPMTNSLSALSTVAAQLGVPALSAVANNSSTVSAQFYGDLLTSNTVLDSAVTTTYDASAPGEFGGIPFRGTLIDYVKPTGKTAADNRVATMEAVTKGMLSVNVDRPTGIVRFQVHTKNRVLSGLIARRLLDLVNEFNLKRRQTQAGAERDFDLRRTQASLDSLHASEVALAEFRAANIDFSRSPRLAARESELQRRVTLAQQIYTTIAQRYELANIEAVRNTPVVTVIDAPEELVKAMPRHTVAIALGAFAFGLVLACGIALYSERPAAAR
jgi:uncharacterized protein involved in exopolysaccharide biosynthesis